MASLNKVFLIGNLTRDPELRNVGSGVAVCNFRIAIDRKYTTSQGEEREDTCFVDIECWGRQAETCNRYLSKGRPVLIEGRLQQDRWEDSKTGESRSRLLVRAMQVQFLGSGPSSARAADQAAEVRDSTPAPRRESRPQKTNAHRQETEEEEKEEEDMPDFEPVEKSYGNIPF